jgi:malonyl-CoA O-methyltransferase
MTVNILARTVPDSTSASFPASTTPATGNASPASGGTLATATSAAIAAAAAAAAAAATEAARQRLLRRLATAPTPWLHAEVARRMGERLGIVKLQPAVVQAWHAQRGGGLAELAATYERAQILVVEEEGQALLVSQAALPKAPWWARWRGAAQGQTISTQSVAPGSAQLLWSNMALHHAGPVQEEFARWHTALAADGFLMFSTLGPGSLGALRRLYQQQGWGPAHAPFIDMHDLGDELVHAGFADPVMDQEILTLHWSSPQAMLQELRQLGGNADVRRHAGLRTPRWRQRLEQALAQACLAPAQSPHPLDADGGTAAGRAGGVGGDRAAALGGRVSLELEIVYGHAFKPKPRLAVAPETRVSMQAMRDMLRPGKGPAR